MICFLQEQLIKSGNESEQNEEEADEEDTDETLAERIDEARSVLEKLEETRRESKDGKTMERVFKKNNLLFQHDWMMNF
jgi:hypothetical protein